MDGTPRRRSKKDSSPTMSPRTRPIPARATARARSETVAPVPQARLTKPALPKVGSPPPRRYRLPVKVPALSVPAPSTVVVRRPAAPKRSSETDVV